MWIEFWQAGPRPTQRIDLRHQVTTYAVGSDELVDAVLQEGHPLLALCSAGHRRQGQWHGLTGRGILQLNMAIRNGDSVARGNTVRHHHSIVIVGRACMERQLAVAGRCLIGPIGHHRGTMLNGRSYKTHG